METKDCRHCKQPIHKDARRCQHCQGMQSWISDQKDPRILAVVLIPLLLLLVYFFFQFKSVMNPLERIEIDRTSLQISNVSYRFGAGASSAKIYVYGDVTNLSAVDAGKTRLRVNLLGKQDKVIDSFVRRIDSSSVSASETKRFRIVAETPVQPEEIKKTEVVVERSRARRRWD